VGRIVAFTIILSLTAAGIGSPATLANLFYATDMAVTIGDLTAGPNVVIADDLRGSLSSITFPSVPSSTAIRGYVRMTSGTQLIVFDSALTLPSKGGSFVATPRDVVSFDGTNYSMYFNGDDGANGIPGGVAISGLTIDSSNLVIALDTTVVLPATLGGTITAQPNDLIMMTGTGPPYSILFNGATAGLPAGIEISAAAYLPVSRNILFVFDGTGSIGGENFTPRTILDFVPPTNWSSITYDGEDNLGAAKVRAVFATEPTPTSTPTPTATITVTPTPTITPTATSTAVPVTLGVTPKSLRFPTQKLGKTGTTSPARYIRITNPRGHPSAAVEFSTPRLSNQEFAIASNTCTSSIAPGESCQVGVTFKPGALGQRVGTIQIADNARNSPQTVNLSGVSTPASITVKPAVVAFGKANVGGGVVSKTVILGNSNPVALEVDAIEVTPVKAGPNEFSIPAGQCIGELAAGAKCSLTVRFTPAAAGARSARIGISDDAKGSPQSIKLSGSGS